MDSYGFTLVCQVFSNSWKLNMEWAAEGGEIVEYWVMSKNHDMSGRVFAGRMMGWGWLWVGLPAVHVGMPKASSYITLSFLYKSVFYINKVLV